MTKKQYAKTLAPLMNENIQWNLDRKEEEKKKGDPDGMASMYGNDAKNLRKIRSLLRQGKIEEALDKGYGMDTCARELIPDKVWYFLTGEELCPQWT